MAYKPAIKNISLMLQGHNLKKLFPNSHIQIDRSSLTWIVDIMPSPLSNTYKVRLRYKLGGSPQINVLKPELTVPEGQRLPHTYPQERLCLYYPRVGEWRGDMLLGQTIVPWISEWLLHYEVWLVIGQWCGGGIHPTVKID